MHFSDEDPDLFMWGLKIKSSLIPFCRSPQECSVWELIIMNICPLVAIREDSVCQCDNSIDYSVFFQPRASAHPLLCADLDFDPSEEKRHCSADLGFCVLEGDLGKLCHPLGIQKCADFFLSSSFCPSRWLSWTISKKPYASSCAWSGPQEAVTYPLFHRPWELRLPKHLPHLCFSVKDSS